MQKYLPKTWIPPPSRRGLSGGKVLETSPFSSRSFSALIQESLKEMLKRAEEEEEAFGMLHAFLLQIVGEAGGGSGGAKVESLLLPRFLGNTYCRVLSFKGTEGAMPNTINTV